MGRATLSATMDPLLANWVRQEAKRRGVLVSEYLEGIIQYQQDHETNKSTEANSDSIQQDHEADGLLSTMEPEIATKVREEAARRGVLVSALLESWVLQQVYKPERHPILEPEGGLVFFHRRPCLWQQVYKPVGVSALSVLRRVLLDSQS